MGVARSFDVQFLNRVVNDPAMEKSRLGVKNIDLTAAVSDPENIFLANEYGGFLFMKDGDGYEVHTNFLPEGRGKVALDAARDAAAYIFTQTDAHWIRTLVPRGNVAAYALTKAMGFQATGDHVRVNDTLCRVFELKFEVYFASLLAAIEMEV